MSCGLSEFYGGVSGVADGLHLQDVLKFIGMISEGSSLHLEMESSAASGVMNRIGVGQVRHLETKTFWTQELVQAGRLKVIKIKGRR